MKKLLNLTLIFTFLVRAIMAQAGEVTTYYHTDVLGTPVAASDANGNELWRDVYGPYGNKQQDPVKGRDLNIGYTCHRFDRNTQLTYMGARYYDPAVGRFLAVDAAAVDPASPLSFNRFAYANLNPYRYVDPDGRGVEQAVMISFRLLVFAGLAASATAVLNENQGDAEGTRAGPFAPPSGGSASEVEQEQVGANSTDQAETDPRAGKKFTPKGKREVKEANAAENDGEMKCEGCGKTVIDPKQHQKGVSPPDNEAHIDHIDPRSKGGAGSPSNGQVLCRTCNLGKSDN